MVFDMIFYKQSQPWLEKSDISLKITINDLEQHIIDLIFFSNPFPVESESVQFQPMMKCRV